MDPLDGVLEASPDAVLVVDREGIVRRANRNVPDVIGYSPNEIEGMVVEELLLEEDRKHHVQFREQYMESPEPRPMGSELDLYALHKDGTRVPVEIGLGPFEHGGERYVVATITDITERKERERELERQRDRFEYVEQIADIGYWELDTRSAEPFEGDGTKGVFDIYDLPADGDPLPAEEALEFYHPEDRPIIRRAIERAISAGEPYELELRLETASDRIRWVYTVGEPVERDGEIVKVRGIIQDITDRKQQEQELKRQNERLEQFASILSHDLRNPLSVAEGNLELANEEHDSEYLDSVERSLERIRTLIDDLLTLAREGDTIRGLERVELAALSESCWQNVTTADSTIVAETEQTIRANRSRLSQLLENLFRNAIEHGGENVTVTVGALDGGFYVEDDGAGIPEGERENVFEAGYSTGGDGTGLGLNIVEQIVNAHEWEIEILAGDDEGVRFEITDVDVV